MASKKDIIDLETRFWKAIRDEDAEVAVSLMTYPCTLSGAQGVMSLSRDDYTRMSGDASWKLNDFKLDNIDVQFPGKDVAVIGYLIEENITVDGKTVKLKAAETSTWIHLDGNWLCAAHTESILGDAFGRDRQSLKEAA